MRTRFILFCWLFATANGVNADDKTPNSKRPDKETAAAIQKDFDERIARLKAEHPELFPELPKNPTGSADIARAEDLKKKYEEAWTPTTFLDDILGDAPKIMKMRVVSLVKAKTLPEAVKKKISPDHQALIIEGGILDVQGLMPHLPREKALKLWSVPVNQLFTLEKYETPPAAPQAPGSTPPPSK